MPWRLAEALKTLRNEINADFPTRSKISDGSVGDLSHSQRKSDHNPNGANVVTAIDVTNDEKTLTGQMLANALYASKDKRIKYLIWNKQITVQPIGSGWKAYTGANAHKHHVHISVSSDPKLYDDAKEWNLNFSAAPSSTSVNSITTHSNPLAQPSTMPPLKLGSSGVDVKILQEQLVNVGLLKSSDVDGSYGPKTKTAVILFQRSQGLTYDGIFGDETRRHLAEVKK